MTGNQLPLQAHRNADDGEGCFNWDEDLLLLQLKDGLGEGIEVTYIGCLKEEVAPNEQDDAAQILLKTFKCVPAFLIPEPLLSSVMDSINNVCGLYFATCSLYHQILVAGLIAPFGKLTFL